MSPEIRDVVREKYGQAAQRALISNCVIDLSAECLPLKPLVFCRKGLRTSE